MARLLLDENLPRLLGLRLTGHHARTVQQSGWSGLKNGHLLRRAADSYDVFLTMDRSIPFQQSVSGLDISVLIVRAPSNKLASLEAFLPAILAAIPLCLPGTVSVVGDWH
jgi:hypothetical protein